MSYDKRGNKNPKWRGGPIKLNCIGCGKKSFYNRGKRIKKYCSHKCYICLKIKNRGKCACDVCGKVFLRPPKHISRVKKKLCSNLCKGIAQRGENNSQYDGGPIHKNCVVCGNKMILPRKNRAKQVTCGTICRGKRLSEALRKERVRKVCLECSAEFFVVPSVVNIRKFCSMPCKDSEHSRRISGKGNGRYVHGMANAPYPPEWNNSHKKLIRERDGYICQLCGLAQTIKKHDVHHINYIKDDISPYNLITLCRRCHSGCHGNLESRKKCKERLLGLLKKQA